MAQLMTICGSTIASMLSYVEMSQFIYVKIIIFFLFCANFNVILFFYFCISVAVDMIIDLASCPFTYSLHISVHCITINAMHSFKYKPESNKKKKTHIDTWYRRSS